MTISYLNNHFKFHICLSVLDLLAWKLPHGTDPEKNLSVIIKAHCVFQHIPETIERTGKGLGVFSAAAFEHVLGDFIETWKIFKVHPTHPDYRKQFKSCVVHYDSHHISYI